MGPDAAIALVARRQHGLITLQQAVESGLSKGAVRHRVATGRWEVQRRGVFAIGGVPGSERQTILAAQLATGGIASHLTAGRLWGLELPAPRAIHLLGSRSIISGVQSHRTRSLHPSDRMCIGALGVTSPARTLVDCAATVPMHELGAVVDDALRRGLLRPEALRACHARLDVGAGPRNTIALRAVLAKRAPGYAAGDSERELDIVRLLADADLPAPVLGHRVRVGSRTYKLDIAWPEIMTAIEFDGWATHKGWTAFHRDRNRVRRIVASGWTVLPVTAETDLHELVGDVTVLLRGRSATA